MVIFIGVKSTILIHSVISCIFPIPDIWVSQIPGWYSLELQQSPISARTSPGISDSCRPKTDQITGFSFYKKRNSSKCVRRSSHENKERLRHSSRLNNSDTGITTAATSTTTRSTAAANDRAGWHHGHSRTQRKVFTTGDNVSIQLCSGLVFTLTDPDKWRKGKWPGRGEEKNRWFTGTITFYTIIR